MMGYLQRLAQRAEGVSLTPSIIPARYNLTTRDQTPDPFATSETVASFVSPTRTPVIIQEGLENPDVENDQLSAMVPGRKRIRRAEADLMEDSSVPAEIKPAFRTRPSTIEPPTSRNEVSSPPLTKTESRKAHVDTLENETDTRIKSTLSSRREVSEPIATRRPLEETFESPRVVATAKLEPPRADIFSDEPLPRDEPRLVIGQLRVEVIPGAPTQAREVVRTVTRTVGPSQIKRPGLPTSRLRFGLGQM